MRVMLRLRGGFTVRIMSLGGSRGGLMVSALDSAEARKHCTVRHLTLTVPISISILHFVLCKFGAGGGGTLQGTSIPSRGSRNTPSRFMLLKLG